MKKVFGIGIVGCGYSSGRLHYRILSEIPDKFKVKACFDIDKNRTAEVAKIYEAKACSSLEMLLNSPEIDLVLIATKPPSTHTETALAALDAGKHVLIEKPMCGSHKEGAALIKKAHNLGKILTVYHNRRLDPDFVSMRWAIEKGYLGNVNLFESLVCANFLDANWLFDWGVHIIDQALVICGGNPTEVSCISAGDPETESGSWFALIRFDNGKTALTTMRTGITGSYPRYSVIGDKGAVAWPIWQEGTINKNELIFDMPPIALGKGDQILKAGEQRVEFTPFYQNLYDVMNGNAELAVKPEEALKVVDVTLAIIKSSLEKRTIKL